MMAAAILAAPTNPASATPPHSAAPDSPPALQDLPVRVHLDVTKSATPDSASSWARRVLPTTVEVVRVRLMTDGTQQQHKTNLVVRTASPMKSIASSCSSNSDDNSDDGASKPKVVSPGGGLNPGAVPFARAGSGENIGNLTTLLKHQQGEDPASSPTPPTTITTKPSAQKTESPIYFLPLSPGFSAGDGSAPAPAASAAGAESADSATSQWNQQQQHGGSEGWTGAAETENNNNNNVLQQQQGYNHQQDQVGAALYYPPAAGFYGRLDAPLAFPRSPLGPSRVSAVATTYAAPTSSQNHPVLLCQHNSQNERQLPLALRVMRNQQRYACIMDEAPQIHEYCVMGPGEEGILYEQPFWLPVSMLGPGTGDSGSNSKPAELFTMGTLPPQASYDAPTTMGPDAPLMTPAVRVFMTHFAAGFVLGPRGRCYRAIQNHLGVEITTKIDSNAWTLDGYREPHRCFVITAKNGHQQAAATALSQTVASARLGAPASAWDESMAAASTPSGCGASSPLPGLTCNDQINMAVMIIRKAVVRYKELCDGKVREPTGVVVVADKTATDATAEVAAITTTGDADAQISRGVSPGSEDLAVDGSEGKRDSPPLDAEQRGLGPTAAANDDGGDETAQALVKTPPGNATPSESLAYVTPPTGNNDDETTGDAASSSAITEPRDGSSPPISPTTAATVNTPRLQMICGIPFEFKPPPKRMCPHAAKITDDALGNGRGAHTARGGGSGRQRSAAGRFLSWPRIGGEHESEFDKHTSDLGDELTPASPTEGDDDRTLEPSGAPAAVRRSMQIGRASFAAEGVHGVGQLGFGRRGSRGGGSQPSSPGGVFSAAPLRSKSHTRRMRSGGSGSHLSGNVLGRQLRHVGHGHVQLPARLRRRRGGGGGGEPLCSVLRRHGQPDGLQPRRREPDGSVRGHAVRQRIRLRSFGLLRHAAWHEHDEWRRHGRDVLSAANVGVSGNRRNGGNERVGSAAHAAARRVNTRKETGGR